MNKLYRILPAKRLTLIQNIVTLLLLLAIVFMSFGAVFTVEVDKENEATAKMFDKVVNSFGGDHVEMPDTVDVSAPYIIKSVGSVVDILKNGMDALQSATELSDSADKVQDDADSIENPDDVNELQENVDNLEQQANKAQEGVNKLAESLKEEDFVGLVTLIVIIFQAFADSLILGLVYLALISLSLSLPIVAAIRFLCSLISFFRFLGNPGEGYAKLSKSFGAIFVMLPTLWIFKLIAPQIVLGEGINTMVKLCIAILAINFVCSRLKCYTPAQFKYINVLQGASLFGVVGYFLVMTNIDGMGIFDKIWDKMVDIGFSGIKNILAILVVLVFILILVNTCKLIKKLACRLCCMVPAGKNSAHDTNIVSAVLCLGLIAAPVYLMYGGFGLDMGDGMKAFITFSVGAGLIFVSELVMVILKNTLCAQASADDVHAVLTGCPTGEPKVREKAEKKVEAPAEEKATEEDVAEEVESVTEAVAVSDEAVEAESVETVDVAEETPVEIVFDEAVAEDAVAEEAVEEAVEEVVADESVAEEAVEEVVADEPVAEEVVEEVATEEVAAEEEAVKEVTEEVVEEPAAEEVVAEEVATEESVADEVEPERQK